MARTVRNAKIDSRSGRAGLKVRHEPYWTVLTGGRALGYRKGKVGTWVGRYRTEQGERYHKSLGVADDALDANGEDILSYAQAQERARDWFKDLERRLTHGIAKDQVYTVGRACDDYLNWFETHRKSHIQTKSVIDQFIQPELGDIEVNKLTKKRIEEWQRQRTKDKARVRSRRGEPLQFKSKDDPEAERRRKSTANRQLTVLKAILNRAFDDARETGVSSDDAWRKVKPYKDVERARVRWLADDELSRFLSAAAKVGHNEDPGLFEFAKLATGALLLGARYGELVKGRVADFDPAAGTVFIPESKSGKARHVVLTDEGREFFTALVAGRPGDALLFRDASGNAWGKSQQARPITELCARAKIAPAIGVHALRHTYASRLVSRGVPLMVVAQQLGHADTRMVEKHYGHLAPNYVTDTVRANFGELGLKRPAVVTLGSGRTSA
ncbi:tyrosine-type recombinase/integrase [Emcibacter sp. SYSU 3D8]|uniref:tyrosine-type recombinase/integrase n=1 Tax=Emcibacter sp. SYSU 3D8 TaxID=3133969 RepID=UPI0031FF3EB9